MAHPDLLGITVQNMAASLRFYRLLVLWRGLVLIRARVVVIKIGRCHGWQCKDGNQS